MAKKKVTVAKKRPVKSLRSTISIDDKPMQVGTALRHRALLEALQQYRGHISKACALVGIDRSTYYEFLKDPDFAISVENIKAGKVDDYIEALDTIALDSKFFPAVKYFLDNHAQDRGYGKELQAQKIPEPVNNIQINLATLPVETLKQLKAALVKQESEK